MSPFTLLSLQYTVMFREYARKKKGSFERMVKEALNRLGLEDVSPVAENARKRKHISPAYACLMRQLMSYSNSDAALTTLFSPAMTISSWRS